MPRFSSGSRTVPPRPRLLPVLLGLALLLAAGPGRASSLSDAMGGPAGFRKIASGTIDNALADPRIGPVFVDVNIPRLKGLLAVQLCQVAGGPCVYEAQNMHQAHAGLHLREADFNALVEDMEKAMDALGIPYYEQTKLLARLAPMERQVVTQP